MLAAKAVAALCGGSALHSAEGVCLMCECVTAQSLVLLLAGLSLLRHTQRPGQDGEGASVNLARKYVCFHIKLFCYCAILLCLLACACANVCRA